MNSIYKLSAALLFTTLIAGSACQDEDKAPTVYLNENFKEFIYFKEGTEWTYMNLADSTLATSVVTENRVSISEWRRDSDNRLLANVESFVYSVFSARLNRSIQYRGTSVGAKLHSEEYLKYEIDWPYYIAYRESGSSRSHTFYYYPHIGTEKRPMGLSTITLAEHLDSLNVGGRYYHDVYRIHETKNPIEGVRETNFYVARGYGIIRKEINDKERDLDPDNWQQWDLIESTIIQ